MVKLQLRISTEHTTYRNILGTDHAMNLVPELTKTTPWVERRPHL